MLDRGVSRIPEYFGGVLLASVPHFIGVSVVSALHSLLYVDV